MMRPPEPKNQNGTIPVPADFVHGDHAVHGEAAVVFEDRGRRFGGALATRIVVVVRCHACGWNARANDIKYASASNPNSNFTEKAIRRILVQALNNFKSKVPSSCAEALARIVMSS